MMMRPMASATTDTTEENVASPAVRSAMGVMYLLMFTGILGRILSFAVDAVISGAGILLEIICRLAGLF